MLSRIILLCIIFATSATSQTFIEQNVGGWSGQLSDVNNFVYDIYIEKDDSGTMKAKIKGINTEITWNLLPDSNNRVYSNGYNDFLSLSVNFNDNMDSPIMFLRNSQRLSNINLNKVSSNKWKGSWNLFLVKDFDPTFYLSVDQEDHQFAAYGFFRAASNYNMNCQNFSHNEKQIRFEDKNSGIKFEGSLINPDSIHLYFKFLNDFIEVGLKRLDYEKWQIGISDSPPISYTGIDIPSQKDLQSLPLEEAGLDKTVLDILIEDIKAGKLPKTHSVLISKNNKLIFEEYFQGFDYDTPHDTRSASKTIATAAIGIAIDQKYIQSVNNPIAPYFKEYSAEFNFDPKNNPITIHHLLTMSTGLDIIDGAKIGNSYAAEWIYQSKEDWTRHILKAPLVFETGSSSYYGSGNPHLLGEILRNATNQSIEYYLYDNFIKPLGWSGYKIQTDKMGLPYFGGGWYLTSRDFLRFGLLFLNSGMWNDKQILSVDWVDQAIAKHNILKNRNNIEYGYLLWHRDYHKGDKKISSIEARGNGGQYLFLLPEYDMAIVITSGNYRNRDLLHQPELILEKYILKALKN